MHLGGEKCVITVLLLDSKKCCFPGQLALKAAIRQYITVTNAQPKPFRWTKTADDNLGGCPTLTLLLRRTIRDHLRRARPAPKNRET